MHLRNGFRSAFRAPVKTILSLLLLAVTVLFVNVSAGSYRQSLDQLSEINSRYTSIAVLDKTGGAYPDDTAISNEMYAQMEAFDPSVLTSDPSVTAFYPTRAGVCTIEGYDRVPRGSEYEDSAIIRVRIMSHKLFDGCAYAKVLESVFSAKPHYTVYVNTSVEPGLTLEYGHEYLLHGTYDYGLKSFYTLTLKPFASDELYGGQPLSAYVPYVDVTDLEGDAYESAANVMNAAANFYRDFSSCLGFRAVSDLGVCEEFEQGLIYLKAGREFTDEELTSDSRVCMVSDVFAMRLGVKVGDTVRAALYTRQPGKSMTDSLLGTAPSAEEYTVIGTFTGDTEYNYTIYFPYESVGASPVYGYTIGTVVLHNGETDSFLERMQSALPSDYAFRVYDEGYSLAIVPYESLCRTSLIIMIISVLIGLAVTGVFVYLLVVRQRGTAKTMSDLGTPRRGILAFLLTGAGVPAVPAVMLGGVVSAYLQKDFFLFLLDRAKETQPDDLRYSNSKLGVVKEYTVSVVSHPWLVILVSLVCLFAVFLLCFAGTFLLFRKPKQKPPKKQKQVKVRGLRVSTLGAGAARYPLISVRRNLVRSFAVVLTVAAIASLLSALSFAEHTSEVQLDDMQNGSYRMSGCFASIGGKSRDNLVVRSSEVAELYQTGLVDRICVTVKTKCFFAPEHPFDGIDPWALQSYLYELRTRGDSLVYTSDISLSPEFLGTKQLNVTFADGYTMDSLATDSDLCVVPYTYLAEKRLSFGDQLALAVLVNENGNWQAEIRNFTVVGGYAKVGTSDTVYASIGNVIDMEADIYRYMPPNPADRYVTEVRTAIRVTPYQLDYDEGTPLSQVEWDGVTYRYPTGMPTVTVTDASGKTVCLPQVFVLLNYTVKQTDTYTGYWTATDIMTRSTVWQDAPENAEIVSVTLGDMTVSYPSGVTMSYVPELELMLPSLWVSSVSGQGEPTASAYTYKTLSSVSFTLGSISELGALRDAMEAAGFGQASEPRMALKSYVLILDKSYNDLVRTLKENIRYLSMISRVILLLAVGISFLVSYLLTGGRKQEMAAMRSLGAGRGRVFFTFFFEQVLLLLVTTGAVFGVFTWFTGFRLQSFLYLVAFIGCYLVGCALSIFLINSRRVLGLLAEKE